ncbi:PIN domain nuclease [cyanobacterium TDX16]|nr:PIN domain nuclease [cyanobacterium TDX16]
MTLLLDTQVWLWMLTTPERLSPVARGIVEDEGSDLLLSAASSWEISIKNALGKLPLPEPPDLFVPSRISATGVRPVAVEHAHALRVATLPMHHRDPFDRLLVAQAIELSAPLITADQALAAYEIDIVDA